MISFKIHQQQQHNNMKNFHPENIWKEEIPDDDDAESNDEQEEETHIE